MAAKLGQKKKGQQKAKKPAQPVNDIEKDSNVVLTKTTEEVNVKRDKAKAAEKKTTGFFAFFRKFDPIAMSCFIAIILAGVVVIGAYVNATYIDPEWDSPVAVEGDTVKVQYVGSYGAYYDQDGAVIFDTNLKNVNDSSDYTKSISYTNKTKFDYLEFEVGGDDVLKMFGDAVIGKLINWEAKVKIPAAEGYGVSQKFDMKSFVIDMTGTMTLEEFNDYTGSNLKVSDLSGSSKIVKMPIGLNAEVNIAANDCVTYKYVDVSTTQVDDASDDKVTKIDPNTKYDITAVNANSFTVSYKTDGSRMFKAVNCENTDTEQIIYIDNFDTAEYKWKVGAVNNDDMEEQKGEYLYFWIKIVDINGYAGE